MTEPEIRMTEQRAPADAAHRADKAGGRVAVLGAGLAGMAASAALGSAGFSVDLFEARAFPGGRATSWPVTNADGESGEVIDNCQHVLLRCCVNLLDLY